MPNCTNKKGRTSGEVGRDCVQNGQHPHKSQFALILGSSGVHFLTKCFGKNKRKWHRHNEIKAAEKKSHRSTPFFLFSHHLSYAFLVWITKYNISRARCYFSVSESEKDAWYACMCSWFNASLHKSIYPYPQLKCTLISFKAMWLGLLF